MPVSRLTLTDFRSYAEATIEPGPGFVLLYGENGAGKTNLLEALSMLTPGRGLRGAALSQMARRGSSGGWGVAARLCPRSEPTAEDVVDIGTGTLATTPERRQMRINGAPASVNSLSEWLSILWLTPAMDRLFTGTAGERRRFIDRLVLALEPSHAHHSTRYDAAMRARNKLLADDSWDEAWVGSLEQAMAEHGAAIAEARARTIADLDARLSAAREDDFPGGAVTLEGWVEGELAASLKANRARDAIAGRATEGPHRQDLAAFHRTKRMPAAQSSTGEQKALLINILLCHAEVVAERRGEPPILLLDEVAAHLDPHRRGALFEHLTGRGQVWMTATEADLFAGISDASRYRVADGALTPA